MLYLAAHSKGDFVPIREVSSRLGFSQAFLTKILQSLTQHGILQSQRGPKGGVALIASPEAVTLKQLIEILDGPDLFEACVLGLPGCGTLKPCPLHERWRVVRGGLHTVMEQTSVAAMLANPPAALLPMLDSDEAPFFQYNRAARTHLAPRRAGDRRRRRGRVAGEWRSVLTAYRRSTPATG